MVHYFQGFWDIFKFKYCIFGRRTREKLLYTYYQRRFGGGLFLYEVVFVLLNYQIALILNCSRFIARQEAVP